MDKKTIRKRMIRRISFIIVAHLIILAFCPITSSASSGTKYETELNNSYTSSNETFDDFDNYGSISSSTDEDWWKITYSTGGIANFYLGNIPTGCDYDLRVYKNDGTTLVVKSLRSSNQFELAQCRIYPNTTYYIKVSSISNYSVNSQYLLRVKKYTTGTASFFAYNHGSNTTYSAGLDVMSTIWSMGIGGNVYLNNNATPVYNTITNSRLFVIDSLGFGGAVLTYDTYLHAITNEFMEPGDKALSTLASNSMTNKCSLIMFVSGNSGNTTPGIGNLVDTALSKGTRNCIGWTNNIGYQSKDYWLRKYFEALAQGESVFNAGMEADDATIGYDVQYGFPGEDSGDLLHRYYGTPFYGLATVFR